MRFNPLLLPLIAFICLTTSPMLAVGDESTIAPKQPATTLKPSANPTEKTQPAKSTKDPVGPTSPMTQPVPLPSPSGDGALMPSITPGPSITLAEALKQAETQNLDLKVAQLAITQTKAKLKTTWGLLHPVIQAKLNYTHMDHEDTVDLASSFAPLIQAMGITLPEGTDMGKPLLTNPQEKLTGALEAMIPLINAENWYTIKVAKQGVEVATLSIEQARRQILLGVAQTYFMALTTRDLIDFYHSQIITTKEQRRIAEARFNAGRGMRIDVIRAETDLEKANQSLRSALLGYDNVRDALAHLIGAEGLPMPAQAPSLQVPDGDTTTLEQQAVTRRTDIQIDSAKIELFDRQLNAVWMKFLPTLNLAAQGSYQFTEMADLGSTDRSRWAVMLSLTVPIYNYFRYADLDEKRAQLTQANLSLENAKKKAALAVRKAQRDYADALTAVATAEKQAALAEEGLKLVEAAYRAGTTSSLDVTDARGAHTAAGFNLATSQFKAQLALLSLIDAVGSDLSKESF